MRESWPLTGSIISGNQRICGVLINFDTLGKM